MENVQVSATDFAAIVCRTTLNKGCDSEDNMEMAERSHLLSVQIMSMIRFLDWLDTLLACR